MHVSERGDLKWNEQQETRLYGASGTKAVTEWPSPPRGRDLAGARRNGTTVRRNGATLRRPDPVDSRNGHRGRRGHRRSHETLDGGWWMVTLAATYNGEGPIRPRPPTGRQSTTNHEP